MKKTFLIMLLLITGLFAVSEGERAPDFTLVSLKTSQQQSLKSFRGKVVLLNLWASWCKGCKKEMPEFVALQHSIPKGFRIVAVSLDDDAAQAKRFLDTLSAHSGNIPFAVLHDSQKKVAQTYDCKAMPSSYLIDKHGIIRKVIIGSLDHDQIEALKEMIRKLQ